MKKITVLLITFITLFILPYQAFGDESFTIDKVTIEAEITEDGIMHVKEQFTYTFIGEFEGVTRSIESDVRKFHAYLNGEALEVEEDDDLFKIYTSSQDETKSVVYEYEVHGSVHKYQDIAEIVYAFFDSSNETDLHDVDIFIETPRKTVTDQTYFFLDEDGQGDWNISQGKFHYHNPLLKAEKDSYIRIVFPASELHANVELKKDKPMLNSILAEEKERALREANLEANSQKIIPILIGFLFLTIIVGLIIMLKHPSRYCGDKNEDRLIRLVEKTDPLFVKYLEGYYSDIKGSLTDNSFLAGLLSLKQRGLITLAEVPSKRKDTETTVRFTWKGMNQSTDEADHYMYSWLFTNKDEQGEYFLLESLSAGEEDADEVKREKAEAFHHHFNIWSKLVLSRKNYQNLRLPFRWYTPISIFFTLVSFGIFYHFTTIDPISKTEQMVYLIIIGSLSLINIVLSRWKWLNAIYYPILIVFLLIGFTFTSATLTTLIFYIVAFIVVLFTPAFYLHEDVKQLKYAIHHAKILFRKGQYPINANPKKAERSLEYAIVLGEGERYGKQCGKMEFTEHIQPNLPLLYNPSLATSILTYQNIALYTAITSGSSTTNTTTSSTGGGGAGAF